MRVLPPSAQILEAEDPWFGRRTIGDRRPGLLRSIKGVGVEPVETLAAGDVRLQVGLVVNRRSKCCIGMIEPVAPIRQRHVVIDADEVDVGVRPERVEVEEDIARPIVGMVTEVFRPVGGIADLGLSAEDGARIGSKGFERGHRRIGAGARPNGGQTGHFRTDQE